MNNTKSKQIKTHGKRNIYTVGNSKIFIRKHEDFLSEDDSLSIGISKDDLSNYLDFYGVLGNATSATQVGDFKTVTIESRVGREYIATIPNTYESVVISAKNQNFSNGDTVYLQVVGKTKDDLLLGDCQNGIKKSISNKIEEVRNGINDRHVFSAKIVSKNSGGFFILVDDLYKGFMPGSVASLTQILDYDSMIGKELKVMISGFEGDNPLFSNKRFIEESLFENVKLLDRTTKYTGTVSGVQKFGVFVQWDGLYTGLIHSTEYSEDFSNKVGSIRKGDNVDFYLKKIDGDRILLTTKETTIETGKTLTEITKTIEENSILSVSIKKIVQNGVVVDVCEGLESFVYMKDDVVDMLMVGDAIKVVMVKVDVLGDAIKLKHYKD